MRVVGYIRVSTNKQQESGLSLSAQETKIRQYCDLYDLDLAEIIVDAGESAKTLNRDGIQKAINLLKSGSVEGLIVTKLDRLTRSIRDLNVLIEEVFSSSSLFSVNDQVDTRSASGRLILNILMSVSQWERESTAQRTSTAMQELKRKGKYTGGKTPLGWQINAAGDEVPDEDEQELISIVRGYIASRLSYSTIASKLTEAEFTSRTGSAKFSKSAVKRINDAETTAERATRLEVNHCRITA